MHCAVSLSAWRVAARSGLIGESRCGKRITALALMGLLPDGARVSGSMRLNGILPGPRSPNYSKQP